mmetsp:Transcript_11104/g.30684  ORF Transcript_11104/g.30684 Transcript_11104/m.30684 type:complete len:213 (-) Transcript_11104:1425-2063(-)
MLKVGRVFCVLNIATLVFLQPILAAAFMPHPRGLGCSVTCQRWTKDPRGSPPTPTELWAEIPNGAVRDREEPLSAMFERAVVLQRAGSYEDALKEYDVILKAAKQCNIEPKRYAEVHVNMGALYMRLGEPEEARHHFRAALSRRKIGKVYINLAVLSLQELKTVQNKELGRPILEKARKYCQDALKLDEEDGETKVTATRLLSDVDRMMQQM